MQSNLQARPVNWLPLPVEHFLGGSKIVVDEADQFSKGEVVKFFPQQGYGFVRIHSGVDVYFNLAELDLVGPKADPGYLKPGSRVGYDVSWTSKGLHISKLKIY